MRTAAFLAAGAFVLPGLTGLALPHGQAGASAAAVPGPQMKLIPAQNSITAPKYGREVYLDPGIWLGALGSPLQLDVSRASYKQPLTVTQVISPPYGGTVRQPWPASVLDGWNGLKNFVTMTVRNSAGTVVATKRAGLCPDTFDTERVTPDSPSSSPYPQQCAFDPFMLGTVWGIQQDWAVDPFDFGTPLKLNLGTYHVTETISDTYVKLLSIPAADATATVKVKVVKSGCCSAPARLRPAAAGRALPSDPAVPVLTDPSQAALPDLVPLPSWGIRTSHVRSSGQDLLDFGATVWIGGNSPLDVEGFRSSGSPTMQAYQYFWQNGQVIGRAPAGTMGFDTRKGHNHWHFQQFARYQLLSKSKTLVVRSHKQGFCIAPSDPVNLLLPGATWQPSAIGFGGQCGSPTALWVREELPLGWGDTYFQYLAGQSFDITHVPNGTYYIEVTANPQRLLYETSTSNDNSFRKVVLGGTPGHRTVKVPAWNGIDPER